MQRRICECHGEPMYPNTDGWRCSVNTKERNRKLQRTGDYYLKRRRRELAQERERITNQLKELAEDGSGSEQG